MSNHSQNRAISNQAPYGYQTPHQLPDNLNRALQPDQVSGYSSLATWHGGHPPLYPPRGQPAPLPQPPAQQPRPHQPPSIPVPLPTRNWNHRVPVPPSSALQQRPSPSSGAASSSLNRSRNGGHPATQADEPQFLHYSASSTRQDEPNSSSATCVCGASFNAPRERERHWRAFKCGAPTPRYAADLFIIPARYADQKPHEVDLKWLPVLLKAFEKNPHPSKETRVELAWNLKVPRYAVDNWFWSERDVREID